jgi:hypothetical protein
LDAWPAPPCFRLNSSWLVLFWWCARVIWWWFSAWWWTTMCVHVLLYYFLLWCFLRQEPGPARLLFIQLVLLLWGWHLLSCM